MTNEQKKEKKLLKNRLRQVDIFKKFITDYEV